MPRVIAGSAGGRRFAAPEGRGTRPMTDRVREALFSSVAADIPEAVVLDLYAGSGGVAAEALSRGAARAELVEADRRAAALAERNLAALGLAGGTVHRRQAADFCAAPTGGPFDLVVSDPPFDLPLGEAVEELAALASGAALAPGARVVLSRRRGDPDLDPAAPPALGAEVAVERVRSYGDTILIVWRARDGAAS